MMIQRVYSFIWDTQVEEKPFFLAWGIRLLRLAAAIARDIRDGFLGLRATSLVYTTLLSLAPLLAVSFAVLKGFGVHNQIEPFMREFLRPLGVQGDSITLTIVGFVDNINVGVLGAMGVALLIYSVIALLQKIETAFNEIWNVPATRSLAVRLRDYFSVLMIGPLFLFLSVAMSTAIQHAQLVQQWLNIDIIAYAFDTTFLVLPYLLFTLAFTVLYMFMPNTRVSFLPAFAAGAVTGAMWKIMGFLFGVFIAGSASYAAIYSAFASIILFIFWLYVGWLIVLVGASLAYYLQYPSNQRLSRRLRQMSLRVKEKMALLALAEIGKVFYAGEKPLSLVMLSRRLRLPVIAVGDVTKGLMSAGILALTGDKQQVFIPASPFDTTSIHDMLTALRRQDEDMGVQFAHLAASQTTDRILELSDRAARVVLGNITLKQLALGDVKT